MARKCKLTKENLLLLLTIAGVLAGLAIGVGIKYGIDKKPTLTPRQNEYLKFIGDLFLRMLKMLILPLIMTSLVNSMLALDSGTAGKIGLYSILYYTATTLLAVITGIILVVSIQPGASAEGMDPGTSNKKVCKGTIPSDTIMDLLRNMFPDNILTVGFEATQTCVSYVRFYENGSKIDSATKDYDGWAALNKSEQELYLSEPYQITKDGMNVLGLIIFSLVFGFIVNRMGEPGLPIVHLFKALETAIMKIITIVIWFSPVGIMFLIAAKIVAMDDLGEAMAHLGLYMVTVLTGLFIHGFVTLPILFVVFARRNPFTYMYGLLQALLTAFGTSSSSATLPVTLECLETKNHVHPRVTRFVIPLGATINMDGTALYEAVAAIYIAQATNEALNFGHIILISLTATLASIGAAGIPQAGLVTMIMVLIAVGLDPKYITLIIPVDWFLDRVRTTINVLGDSYGAGVVHRMCGNKLDQIPQKLSVHDKTALEMDDGAVLAKEPLEEDTQHTTNIAVNESTSSHL